MLVDAEIAAIIDEQRRWADEHLGVVREPGCRVVLDQPLLDDDTVARIIRVHRDQADDLDLFQNQADKWKADPGLTGGQRAGVTAYETLITQLRQVNAEVLAATDELSHGTINTVLAKSDLELGIEALMRRMQP